jgi:hypothetical protein
MFNPQHWAMDLGKQVEYRRRQSHVKGMQGCPAAQLAAINQPTPRRDGFMCLQGVHSQARHSEARVVIITAAFH